MSSTETRICKSCGESDKDFSPYHVKPLCMECLRKMRMAQFKKRYHSNIEKYRKESATYAKRWRDANVELAKARCNEWRRKHPDAISRLVKGLAKTWQKFHRIANPEKVRERHRAWSKKSADKHRDKIRIRNYEKYHSKLDESRCKSREKKKKYYWQHPDRYRLQARNLYRQDPGRNRAKSNEWRKKNLDKIRVTKRAAHLRRKARKRGLPSEWNDFHAKCAASEFNQACAYCSTSAIEHWDHWIPLSNKQCPGTVPWNMVPACGSCNSSKGNRDAAEWLAWKFPDSWLAILYRVESFLETQKETRNGNTGNCERAIVDGRNVVNTEHPARHHAHFDG